MNDVESLSHTKWEGKYHIVFIPKYRKKALYGALRQQLGEVLKQLAMQRESRIDEGHLMRDHVHMLVSIPPKYSVSQVVGYLKGKSAIHIARTLMGKPRSFTGESFWGIPQIGISRFCPGRPTVGSNPSWIESWSV